MLDAATGDERWVRDSARGLWEVAACADATTAGSTTTLDLAVVTVTSTPTLVSALTCGAWVVATPEGAPLPVREGPVRADRADAVTVVARTRDAVVTALPDGVLAAYDPLSGERLWSGAVVEGSWGGAFPGSIRSAVTDGDTVLLALGPGAGEPGDATTDDERADVVMAPAGTVTGPERVRLVAVDVHNGQIVWEQEREGLATWLFGVDGHLAEITREALAETIGVDGDTVSVRPGTVVGLG